MYTQNNTNTQTCAKMFSPICWQIHRRTAGTEIVIWESFAVTMLTKCMLSDLRLKSIRVYWLLIKTNIKLGCCNLLKYFYPKSWGGGGGGGFAHSLFWPNQSHFYMPVLFRILSFVFGILISVYVISICEDHAEKKKTYISALGTCWTMKIVTVHCY